MDSPDFDVLALNTYLKVALPEAGLVRDVTTAGSGQSNPTYVLSMEQGPDMVLRRKPFGTLLPSAHAIDREYRVMEALANSTVPVPRMLKYCSDVSVIGAEFFLMSRVEAVAEMDPRLKSYTSEKRRAIFTHMAQILGEMHALKLDRFGLGDYGAPGLYFERNLSRWTKQYRASETQTHQQIEELLDWLHAHVPTAQHEICLVHGDYRLDNLLLDESTGQIKAVVDWELSTTGHPLSDLGAVFMQWFLPPGREGRGLKGVNRAELGIPSNQEFSEIYSKARGGADLSDLQFAIPFAFFRMAAILQGVLKRSLDGNAADPVNAKKMASYIPLFASGGLQAAKGWD